MNYTHIEKLVLKAKGGDEASDIRTSNTERFLNALTFIMLTATALWPMLPSKKASILKKLKKALNMPCRNSSLN